MIPAAAPAVLCFPGPGRVLFLLCAFIFLFSSGFLGHPHPSDRKSTRLNSSHEH